MGQLGCVSVLNPANHSHWIFEASTEDSISNVMRDMESRYSHYLNVKYRATPWLLIAPLFGVKDIDHFAPTCARAPLTGPLVLTPAFSMPRASANFCVTRKQPG